MAHELEEGDFTVEVIKPQISIESEKNISLRGGPNWSWVIFTAVQTTHLPSEEILTTATTQVIQAAEEDGQGGVVLTELKVIFGAITDHR